ncbi:MAG: hypothetical protein L3K08_06890 [Thermoplasmata archaeon]|nr:hypothetical protein [Thermoplasmata archaeon]
MGSAGGAPEGLLRERAYLSLLLLVGAGAVTVGVYQTVRSGASSLSAIFDLALGLCVLLVTWLFLAPSAWPNFFGDPPNDSRPVRRSYLGASPTPLLEATGLSRPVAHRDAVNPNTGIPRWADPLVHPRMEGPVRPSVPTASAHGTTAAIPRPSRAATPRPMAPPSRPVAWTEPDLPRAVRMDPEELRPPRWDPELTAGRGTHSLEVLEELDRIEAELRTFVPIESAPVPAAPVGLEDLVD